MSSSEEMPEIAVTPEMIEAGYEEYASRYLAVRDREHGDGAIEGMLEAVFVAMFNRRVGGAF